VRNNGQQTLEQQHVAVKKYNVTPQLFSLSSFFFHLDLTPQLAEIWAGWRHELALLASRVLTSRLIMPILSQLGCSQGGGCAGVDSTCLPCCCCQLLTPAQTTSQAPAHHQEAATNQHPSVSANGATQLHSDHSTWQETTSIHDVILGDALGLLWYQAGQPVESTGFQLPPLELLRLLASTRMDSTPQE
jgi:hypothetical protein